MEFKLDARYMSAAAASSAMITDVKCVKFGVKESYPLPQISPSSVHPGFRPRGKKNNTSCLLADFHLGSNFAFLLQNSPFLAAAESVEYIFITVTV